MKDMPEIKISGWVLKPKIIALFSVIAMNTACGPIGKNTEKRVSYSSQPLSSDQSSGAQPIPPYDPANDTSRVTPSPTLTPPPGNGFVEPPFETNPNDPIFPLTGTMPPLPALNPNSGLKNPIFQTRTWKLWAFDSSPVTIYRSSGNVTLSLPTTPEQRLYPLIPSVVANPGNFLPLSNASSHLAGYWTVVTKSEDNAHSTVPISWSSGGTTATINLNGQFTRFSSGQFTSSENPMAGVQYTNQSTTCMGHNLVSHLTYKSDGSINSAETLSSNESAYFYRNTLRGGPAYYSYRDHLPERTIDSYKGLPVIGHHSFGRSSSEVGGIFKMIVAGGFLTRSLTDLVQHHGLYPSLVRYLFTAALPYANPDGTPVQYLNELRHRPGYLSNGGSSNSEFMPYNQWYHRYPEAEHLYRMTKMASMMRYPPPFAILNFVSIRRELNGTVTTATTLTEASKSSVLVPFVANENISVTVDVSNSIDLGDRPLTYRWQVLYPEQKNVTITKVSDTVYKISMTYDPKLPKMRIPVLMTASNGVFESTPVQVSFYPANANPSCDVNNYELGANPANERNVNNRPLFSTSPQEDVTIPKNGTATYTLNCSDPEGFTTRYYRWLGEPGELVGHNYTFTPKPEHAGKSVLIHFICSDGTGAYNSIERKITVQP